MLLMLVRPSIDRYQLKDVELFIKFNHWCEINTNFYIIHSTKTIRLVKLYRESAENWLPRLIHNIGHFENGYG